jgi:hypothetical protein
MLLKKCDKIKKGIIMSLQECDKVEESVIKLRKV